MNVLHIAHAAEFEDCMQSRAHALRFHFATIITELCSQIYIRNMQIIGKLEIDYSHLKKKCNKDAFNTLKTEPSNV